jgi:hypothetical protein
MSEPIRDDSWRTTILIFAMSCRSPWMSARSARSSARLDEELEELELELELELEEDSSK